jgi:putative alpha-1,2-mannosidase
VGGRRGRKGEIKFSVYIRSQVTTFTQWTQSQYLTTQDVVRAKESAQDVTMYRKTEMVVIVPLATSWLSSAAALYWLQLR